MIYKVFSIFDSKAAVFERPYFAPTTGAGIRTFQDACADPQTMLHRHPEDFHLFEIGEYDDQTGAMASTQPQSLGTAAMFKEDGK